MNKQLFQVIRRTYMANSNYVYNKTLPKVFMDIKVDQQPAQRVVIELFENIVPRTTQNFIELMKGSDPKLSYIKTKALKIVPGLGIQMGDIQYNNGLGTTSIYGPTFPDESYQVSHDQPGVVTMLNRGPDTNGCQFLITFNPLPHLDYQNVAFGKVVEGEQFVFGLDQYGNAEGNVNANIIIENCGEVKQ